MPIPDSAPSVAPQITLFSSIIAYPLLFHLVTPRNASASRFIKSREALSVVHCTLVTFASAYELHQRSRDWNADSPSSFLTGGDDSPIEGTPDSHVSAGSNPAYGANAPLITARSNVGNSIMAFELGYLIQDSVILFLASRIRKQDVGRNITPLVKDINWKVLGWHHFGFSSALGVLQWYIYHGREKGIMVILMLMLMNIT